MLVTFFVDNKPKPDVSEILETILKLRLANKVFLHITDVHQ